MRSRAHLYAFYRVQRPGVKRFSALLPPHQRLDVIPGRRVQAGGRAVVKLDCVSRDAPDPFAREAGEGLRQVDAGVELVQRDRAPVARPRPRSPRRAA